MLTASRGLIESLKMDSLNYQVYTELSDIVSIASEWDSLLEHSPCNRAFSSSKWFIETCRIHTSIAPHAVVARRGAAIAGILPLVLTDEGETAGFTNYLNDYSDIVAAQDDRAATTGLLNHALSAPGGYRRIVLSNVRRDSNCLRALQALESDRAIDQSYRETVSCYYVRLPASHDEYLRTKGSRFRKRLKRLRCLAERSNLAVRELEPENFPPERLSEVFLSLHLSRQKGKSCFEQTTTRMFVKEVIPDLFIKRAVRACALAEGERIVGIDLYTMGDNSLCAWNGGFLREAEHCSPGKLLINAGIMLACALGLEEYDFMRGSEDYKAGWANNSRSIGQMEFTVEVLGEPADDLNDIYMRPRQDGRP